MGTKGSYSYSLMPCFSYIACFSNPLFCIAHLLHDSGALPREKSNYSLGLPTMKRGEKESRRALYDRRQLLCPIISALTRCLANTFGYTGPQRLEPLLCTDRQLLLYPHFLFGHNFTLACRHTNNRVFYCTEYQLRFIVSRGCSEFCTAVVPVPHVWRCKNLFALCHIDGGKGKVQSQKDN